MPPQGGPGGMPPPSMMEPQFVPPPQELPPQIIDDEPPNKKSRTEDHLVPENEWMARNSGPITIQVQIPNMTDKTEWRLNGQMAAYSFSPSDLITSLKSKIQEETGMPPAKQKISYDGMFFKDSNTMAYYNLRNGAVIQLALKERGGRKK